MPIPNWRSGGRAVPAQVDQGSEYFTRISAEGLVTASDHLKCRELSALIVG